LRSAVFLSRDGAIAGEVGDLNHDSGFRMVPFAAAAIHRLDDAGFPVIVADDLTQAAPRILRPQE
jgi:histidinol phosphatase-like enzyme